VAAIDKKRCARGHDRGAAAGLIQSPGAHLHKDDIDHLGNRRIRSVGELLQNQFRVGCCASSASCASA